MESSQAFVEVEFWLAHPPGLLKHKAAEDRKYFINMFEVKKIVSGFGISQGQCFFLSILIVAQMYIK